MKRVAITLLVLLFAPVGAGIASAQTEFQEWDSTTRGSGFLRRGRDQDVRIHTVHLILKRNGDAEVRTFGDSTARFTGRWVGRGPLEVDLDLNSGYGIDAGVSSSDFQGRGRARLGRDNVVERLEIEGNVRSQRISLVFDGAGRSGGVFGPPTTTPPVTTPPSNAGGARNGRFVGAYRSYSSDSRDDYMVVRTLRIQEDGTARLVSRIRGADPRVDFNAERRHGTLLRQIVAAKRIVHEGTWRSTRDRLEVSLDRIGGERVDSRLVFELRGEELVPISWDRARYGSLGFQFTRLKQETDDEDTATSLYFSDSGYGSYEISRDPRANINRVTVFSRANNEVDITLALERGITRRLTGRVIENTSRAITVRLTNSGSADATGTITIEPGSANRIQRLYGDGTLDGRRFSINFTGGRPSGGDSGERINLYQRGSGRFFRDGRRDEDIRSVSVISKSNGDIDLSMEFANGSRLTLTGRLERRDAYTYVIGLTNAGQADASGTLTVEAGSGNSINTIFGDGRIDNQRFSINFAK